MRHTRRHVLKVALNALLLASAPAVASVNPAGGEEVWVLLNPEKQRLQVMRGAKAIVLYNNVSWGRGGVGLKTRVGDNVTPIGEFRVRWINEDSRFRTFFGFDYPTPQYAQLGLLRGDLDDQQYGRIIEARRSGDVPLQNTRLGGALGIHGIGNGTPRRFSSRCASSDYACLSFPRQMESSDETGTFGCCAVRDWDRGWLCKHCQH